MSGLLERIVTSKRAELDGLRARVVHASTRTTLDVVGALRRPKELSLITEIKRKSPSAGALSTVLGVAERARVYAEHGAAMISVLCDRPFFGGSYEDLALVRAAVSVPLLAKEFVIDPVQVERAREAGADAVLVIVRILPGSALDEVIAACHAQSLEAFVEVAGDAELDRAVAAGARVVGVNARDLDTLVMDADRAERVLARVPKDVVAVHLSGIRDGSDVEHIARGRADAALVGEVLMRADDPIDILKRILARRAK